MTRTIGAAVAWKCFIDISVIKVAALGKGCQRNVPIPKFTLEREKLYIKSRNHTKKIHHLTRHLSEYIIHLQEKLICKINQWCLVKEWKTTYFPLAMRNIFNN